jgi:hypothetical protein
VGYDTSNSETEVLYAMTLTGRKNAHAGRMARMQARARGTALDHALLDGADPGGSAALRARAELLTSRSHRDSLADGIERMLDALDGPGPRMRVVPRRAALRANEQPLRSIAATLRGPAPVYAPGVALVHLLVTGAGLERTLDAAAFGRALEGARAALAGRFRLAVVPLRAGHAARVRGGTPATRLSETLALSSDPSVYRRHEAA